MPQTQRQMFTAAHRRIADQNTVMLDLLYGANPLSDDELRALIAKRPELARFAGYLGKRARYTIRERMWSVGPDYLVELDGRPIIGTRPHPSRAAAQAWIAGAPAPD